MEIPPEQAGPADGEDAVEQEESRPPEGREEQSPSEPADESDGAVNRRPEQGPGGQFE
jgi:hypothetical protein